MDNFLDMNLMAKIITVALLSKIYEYPVLEYMFFSKKT